MGEEAEIGWWEKWSRNRTMIRRTGNDVCKFWISGDPAPLPTENRRGLPTSEEGAAKGHCVSSVERRRRRRRRRSRRNVGIVPERRG